MRIIEDEYNWKRSEPVELTFDEAQATIEFEQPLKIYCIRGEGEIAIYDDEELLEEIYSGSFPFEPEVPICCTGLTFVAEEGMTITIIAEVGVQKTVLEAFLNTTEGMDFVNNGYNDDGTYSTAGLTEFIYNGNPASTLYVSSNHLYIFSTPAYSLKVNETWQITRIKLSDFSIRQWTMTNTTNEQLMTNGTRFAFVNNGFVYVKGYNSPYEIYKFEIGNSANVTKIKRSGMSTNDGWPMYAINGRIFYQTFSNNSSSSHVYVVNEETNECLRTEACCTYTYGNTPCYTPVLNYPMLLYCSYGGWSTGPFFILANYLATINNLSEPVTKTADKTMKITYTVQEQ